MAPLVRLDPTVLRASPGEETAAAVVVANPGPTTALWHLDVTGDVAGWATVQPTDVMVPAGGQSECRLRIRVPASAAGGARALPFAVNVRGAAADEVATARGALDVVPAARISVRLEPKSSRGTLAGTHRVLVDSAADAPSRVVLTAHGSADVDIDIAPDSVVVETGSSASARAVVRPRRRLLRGSARRHRFEVRAEPLSGPAVTTAGAMVQRPLTAALVPSVAVALVAVALAVAGFRTFVGKGQDADDAVGAPPDGGARSTAPDRLVGGLPEPVPTVPETTPTTAAPPPPASTVPPVPTEQRRLAFQTTRDGNSEIYAMAGDGTGMVNLSLSPHHDSEPAWSPDGHRLAFDSDRAGTGFDVWVMNGDGSGATRLTAEPAPDGYPAWSPDGTRIAFISLRDGNSEIYVMNADGSAPRRLTTNLADDSRPTWSPSGTRIAFHTNRDGNFEIYSMNAADGTDLVNLTGHPASDLNPAWAPDGTRIAFDSTRDGPNADVYLMGADGTGTTRLTNDPARDFWATWSRDSSSLGFQSGRDGDQEIYVLRLGSRAAEVRLTTSPGLDGEPSW